MLSRLHHEERGSFSEGAFFERAEPTEGDVEPLAQRFPSAHEQNVCASGF
jgi:EAL domain-containing protein (putative c-di-GMP-specific phosphodiesterase class I)